MSQSKVHENFSAVLASDTALKSAVPIIGDSEPREGEVGCAEVLERLFHSGHDKVSERGV